MAPISHQTVKLKKGRHASPEQGVCVMELASMLAGEPFSDHPVSVCPVIGNLLRSYNDLIDDDRRQDLYVYAARVVGSRCNYDGQLERLEHLAEWAQKFRPPRLPWLRSRRRHLVVMLHDRDAITRRVMAVARRDPDAAHPRILGLIDALLRIGQPWPAAPDHAAAIDCFGLADSGGFVATPRAWTGVRV